MRILQLEDDAATAEKVEQALRAAGFDCKTAGLGEGALRLAREQDYDVILLKMGRSNGDGYDVLRQLQQSRVRAPVVVDLGTSEGGDNRAGLEVAGRLAESSKSQAAETREPETREPETREPETREPAKVGDRRRSPRAKVIKGGEIVYNDNQCLSECLVVDMSEGGATLQSADTLDFPDRFLLRFKFGPSYACEVCWKSGNRVGIRFLDYPDAP